MPAPDGLFIHPRAADCTMTSPPAYATTGRDSTAACAPCGKGDVPVGWNLQQAAHRRRVRRLRQIRRQLFDRRREHAAAIRYGTRSNLHPAPRARHPPRRILQPHRIRPHGRCRHTLRGFARSYRSGPPNECRRSPTRPAAASALWTPNDDRQQDGRTLPDQDPGRALRRNDRPGTGGHQDRSPPMARSRADPRPQNRPGASRVSRDDTWDTGRGPQGDDGLRPQLASRHRLDDTGPGDLRSGDHGRRTRRRRSGPQTWPPSSPPGTAHVVASPALAADRWGLRFTAAARARDR